MHTRLIDGDELERATAFRRGLALPPPSELIELLNQLGVAMEKGRHGEASEIEASIRDLVAPGVYEGYLKDEGLEQAFVRVVSVERKGEGANAHTFRVRLEVLDGTDVIDTTTMELIDFLRPVNRSRPPEAQHVGPRFWPF